MLPAIGSVSALPIQGRSGVVVARQPLGEAENGRQLVALTIKEGSGGGRTGSPNAGPTGSSSNPVDRLDLSGGSGPPGAAIDRPAAARSLTELTPGERADVTRLQQRDQQVRQEEKAHAAVAGDLAGPINYVYQRGPDGRQYAVGGSVGIEATTLSGDPIDAKRKAGRMAAAANAAINPSAQDYAAARQAYALGSQLGERPRSEEQRSGFNLTL
ncbi:MAG: putative metalloprotease CJM1_0395 family protein [Pseudomonadota bacterium]